MFGFVYNILFPLLWTVSLPAWLLKVRKRKGFGTGIKQRFSFYSECIGGEPKGGVYLHSVSVGETFIALKIIKKWLVLHPDQKFVLSVSTPTAHHIALRSAHPSVRLIYSPFDIPWMVKRVFDRFNPSKIILIESELWYNFLTHAQKRSIPVILANARLSATSEKRYKQFPFIASQLIGKVQKICLQYKSDRERWEGVGVKSSRLEFTGSIKFDYDGVLKKSLSTEKVNYLRELSKGKQMLTLVSTAKLEEAHLAQYLKNLSETHFLVIIPRHEERRDEVVSDLSGVGYHPILYSMRHHVIEHKQQGIPCLVIDTTGELNEWLSASDIAIVGKSWLDKGGQNPSEPIFYGIPTILGPNMQNFQELTDQLLLSEGVIQLNSAKDIESCITKIEDNTIPSDALTSAARTVIAQYEHSTKRLVDYLSDI